MFFCCFLLGQAVEAFALSMATQSDIASVSNLTLIWSAICSCYIFNEPFNFYPSASCASNMANKRSQDYGTIKEPLLRQKLSSHWQQLWTLLKTWDLLNYSLLILGSFITVVSAPVSTDYSETTPEWLLECWLSPPYVYYGCLLVLTGLVLITHLCRSWESNRRVEDRYYRVNGTLVSILAAVLSSLTLTLSKFFLTLLQAVYNNDSTLFKVKKQPSLGAFYALLLILWLVLVVGSIYVLNLGLSRYEQRVIVPIYEIAGTILTIVSGILFYKGYRNFSTLSFCCFLFGICLMSLGMLLVSLREDKCKDRRRNGCEEESGCLASNKNTTLL